MPSPSPLLILFSLALCLAAVRAAKNLTFEGCTSSLDCLGGNYDLPESVCVGRSPDNLLVGCPNDLVDFCICYPTLGFRYCDNNDDCPDDTYCGISNLTGNQLCVGCKVLGDNRLNTLPVQIDDTKLRCLKDGSNVPSRAPPGKGSDFCSVTMPCDAGYDCLAFTEGRPISCSIDSTHCQCFRLNSQQQAALLGCNSTESCEDPREACIWNVNTGINFCMSCDAPRTSSFLIANETALSDGPGAESPAEKCAKVTPRPNPSNYVDGPNGRTFDACTDDAECLGNRSCVTFRTSSNRPNRVKPCDKSANFCFCRPKKLQKCDLTKDCDQGESCVSTDGLRVVRSCVSNALLDIISRDRYTLFTWERKLPVGSGLSWEKCKFDWQCMAPRRCTAIDDIFGGCAGRESCTCRLLYDGLCESDKDCADGEVCVSYIDGYTKPICVSRKEYLKYDYLALVGDLNTAKPTPLPVSRARGLTEDPCLSDDDCIAPRICRHITEGGYRSFCAGRRQCRCSPLDPDRSNCKRTKPDCSPGEVCAAFKGQVPLAPKCLSEQVFDSDLVGYRDEFGPRYLPSATPSPAKSL